MEQDFRLKRPHANGIFSHYFGSINERVLKGEKGWAQRLEHFLGERNHQSLLGKGDPARNT